MINHVLDLFFSLDLLLVVNAFLKLTINDLTLRVSTLNQL
jgi:hypothetical protein